MTLKRIDRGRNHSYTIDDEPVMGVTTILSLGVPKQALVPWASKVCAEYASDNWETLGALPPSARVAAIKGAPNADRDKAARRGTEVHALAAALSEGKDVTVPDELSGHVGSYMRWVDDWQPQEVLVETPVGHRAHRWAGTLDVVAKLADGKLWLLDFKTSRSVVYPESALQLAAYRNAEIVLAGGVEQPMPKVDATAVVWLRADSYEMVPVHTGPAEYAVFRFAQQVARWTQTGAKDVVWSPLPAPEPPADVDMLRIAYEVSI